MIAAKAQATVNLSRDVADVIPLPPETHPVDPVAYHAWEELMLTAADGIAESVGYDRDVLDAAVGPALEVGVNPPWRVLLVIAQLFAAARDERRSAVAIPGPVLAFA